MPQIKRGKRIIFNSQCTVCRSLNYVTEKNPQETKEKLQLKKYCCHCQKHQEHVEVK